MTLGVLIVDDSVFFRRALRDLIGRDSKFSIIGEAVNGRDAVLKACQLKPDLITMDVEMPVMDGISAVREIMKRCPTAIMMLSSLTKAGAEATLEALDAGAMDFFAKNPADMDEAFGQGGRYLLPARLRMLAARAQRSVHTTLPTTPLVSSQNVSSVARLAERGVISRRGLVAIGSSTGGPAALQLVLQAIPAEFPVPILVAQHMPAAFTQPFANRLNENLAISVVEVADGMMLQPGFAYIIPGAKHGEIVRRSQGLFFVTREPVTSEHFRPSVNILFQSAARVMGGDMLGVVLTGMGDDGMIGARDVRAGGGHIWAQDQATSVIYGMPAAVAKAGLAEAVLPLQEIGPAIARCVA